MFKELHMPSWILIDEYLEICRTTKVISHVSIKAHLFKMTQLTLQSPECKELRAKLSRAIEIEEFQAFSNALRKKFEMNEDQIIPMTPCSFPLPHYVTQAYFRPPHKPNPTIESSKSSEKKTKHTLDESNDSSTEGNGMSEELSRKKMKVENFQTPFQKKKSERINKLPLCVGCRSPKSLSCDHDLCRNCCRKKCLTGEIRHSCAGNVLYFDFVCCGSD